MEAGLQERLLSMLPSELVNFMQTLSQDELKALDSINPNLVAKVYQAGVGFSVKFLLKESEPPTNSNTGETHG